MNIKDLKDGDTLKTLGWVRDHGYWVDVDTADLPTSSASDQILLDTFGLVEKPVEFEGKVHQCNHGVAMIDVPDGFVPGDKVKVRIEKI